MLRLYHGSNVAFDQPDLAKARDHRDFGLGFYTTTLRSQAEDWARNITARLGGEPYLYIFDLDQLDALAVKQFAEICVEWLEMVRANRMLGGVRHEFDVVIGPVANDNTVRTVTNFVEGIYDADEAMRRLRYFRANDQVSLHTVQAMALLELKGREHA